MANVPVIPWDSVCLSMRAANRADKPRVSAILIPVPMANAFPIPEALPRFGISHFFFFMVSLPFPFQPMRHCAYSEPTCPKSEMA